MGALILSLPKGPIGIGDLGSSTEGAPVLTRPVNTLNKAGEYPQLFARDGTFFRSTVTATLLFGSVDF